MTAPFRSYPPAPPPAVSAPRGRAPISRLVAVASARPEVTALVLAASAHLALLWSLPVLPGQDFPQHLAYARILLDYGRPDLQFRDFYELPSAFQPYFVAHYALALLGRIGGVEAALRVLLSAYVVATLAAFQRLVAAIHRPGAPELACSTALGSLVIWNPVFLMGFLQFLIAIPLILAAAALLVDSDGARPSWRTNALLAACAAAAVSTHLAAAGSIVLFACIYTAVRPSPRALSRLACVGSGAAIALAAWMRFGETGVTGAGASINWREALREGQGLDFVTRALRVRWSDPPTKVDDVLSTALGPFRPAVLVVMAAAVAAAALLVRHAVSSPMRSSADAAAFRRAALTFAVVAWLTPWGLGLPSEITFLDRRMFTIAFAFALAAVSPDWFRAASARAVVALGCALAFVHFAYRAAAFAREARPVVELVRMARPLGPMLPLVYHDKSSHFGETFKLTHYLPMYYTSREGGINAQFWARYTAHLPIGYREGKSLRTPPDWHPARFEPGHLEAFRYVLVQSATEDDSPDNRAAAARAESTLKQGTVRIACRDAWCLYRVRDDER